MISEPRADKQKQDEERQSEPTGRKEEMMSRFPQTGAPLSAILLLATAPVRYIGGALFRTTICGGAGPALVPIRIKKSHMMLVRWLDGGGRDAMRCHENLSRPDTQRLVLPTVHWHSDTVQTTRSSIGDRLRYPGCVCLFPLLAIPGSFASRVYGAACLLTCLVTPRALANERFGADIYIHTYIPRL